MTSKTLPHSRAPLLFLASAMLAAIILSNILLQRDAIEASTRVLKYDKLQTAVAQRRLMLREGDRPATDYISHKPAQPPTRSTNSSSPYAYAFVIGGCNPDKPSYRGFVYNILVAARILKELGSTADVVAFFQLSYQYTGGTTIAEEDVKALEGLGIHIEYIPPSPYESFYETVMNKFRILTLTQYRRVLLMDGDVMPVSNLDYLFELSEDNKFGPGNSTLKENLIVSGLFEPSNAGFFMLAPKVGEYEQITDIIHKRQEKAKAIKKGVKFDAIEGWGHKIEAPDQWESRRDKGNLWDFHFAFSDQGLRKLQTFDMLRVILSQTMFVFSVYHWTKYVKKDVSIVFKSKVQNWSANSDGHVRLDQTLMHPFREYSKPIIIQFSACAKFMCDFLHFSGKYKPWIGKPPKEISMSVGDDDGNHLWWTFLQKVNNELKMGIDFEHFNVGRPELGLYASWRDMDKHMEKTASA
jgi:hypothetical protein